MHRCLAVGGDTVISKSVRGLRPPEAGALLSAAVARLQARVKCLQCLCCLQQLVLGIVCPVPGLAPAFSLVLWGLLAALADV